MTAGFKIDTAVYFKIICFPTFPPVCLGSFSAAVLMRCFLPHIGGIFLVWLFTARCRCCPTAASS